MKKVSLALIIFFSVNAFTFDSTYLICGKGNKTTVIGLEVGLKERAKSLTDATYEFAKQYIANKDENDFVDRYKNYSEALITDSTISIPYGWSSSYVVDRYSGELFYKYKKADNNDPLKFNDVRDYIGVCNSVSESAAKQKANSIYSPPPAKKNKF